MVGVHKIAVVGSMNLDLTVRVDNLPSAGETIPGHDLLRFPGGKSSNQAVALSRYGLHPHLIACVGDDESGKFLINLAKTAGVNVEQVEQIQDCPSGTAFITVDDSAENSIIVVAGANARLLPHLLDEKLAALGGYEALILAMEVHSDVLQKALTHARETGAITFINASPMNPEVISLLPLIDFLIVNEHELEQLFVILGKSRIEGLRQLAGLGCLYLVVTEGSRGASYFDLLEADPSPSSFAAPSIKALDATGCGDAFAGSLVAHYVSTKNIRLSMEFAIKAASYAALSPGAQASYGDRQTIVDYFDNHNSPE